MGYGGVGESGVWWGRAEWGMVGRGEFGESRVGYGGGREDRDRERMR